MRANYYRWVVGQPVTVEAKWEAEPIGYPSAIILWNGFTDGSPDVPVRLSRENAIELIRQMNAALNQYSYLRITDDATS